MKFTAFRMKSTKMFMIVVYDHPRSKYFYAYNIYHQQVDRYAKVCWRDSHNSNNSLIAIDHVEKQYLFQAELDMIVETDFKSINISHHIKTNDFRHKLYKLTIDKLNEYLGHHL